MGHVCRMVGCEIVFSPKRKHQRFCNKECRQAYFALARNAGVTLIEKIMQESARGGDGQPIFLLANLQFSPDPVLHIQDLSEESGS